MHDAIATAHDPEIAGRILKVNHAGEFGAVNIYRAQILVSRLSAPAIRPMLLEFLEHEKRHLKIFGDELSRRGRRRCRSYFWCGLGGYVLGLISGVLGKNSILACTAAVEEVVLRHLREQMEALEEIGDKLAYDAVNEIVADEEAHHASGSEADRSSLFFKPYTRIIAWCTESVIWLGMRL